MIMIGIGWFGDIGCDRDDVRCEGFIEVGGCAHIHAVVVVVAITVGRVASTDG